MNEIPGALKIDPLLQAENLAVRHGARIELSGDVKKAPVQMEASVIDFEKQARAKKFANDIKELEEKLAIAQGKVQEGGLLTPTYEKIIQSLTVEIEAKEIEFTGEAGTDVAN